MALSHALGRLLSKLPFLYTCVIFMWVEVIMLGLSGLVFILEGPRFPYYFITGLFSVAVVVCYIWLIRTSREFTVDFFMSKHWKHEAKILFRERTSQEDVPDFKGLKRLCIVSFVFCTVIAVLYIIPLYMENGFKELNKWPDNVRFTFLIVMLRIFSFTYLGWTWYAMRFVERYEPPVH